MKLSKIFSVTAGLLVSFIASVSGNLRIEEALSLGLFVYFLLNFINSIGKSYNMLDIPILLALFQCLLMPTIVFNVYNDDALVIALKYDMGVSADVYYGFMFPAVLALIAGIKIVDLTKQSFSQQFVTAIHNSGKHLKGKGNIGIIMIIIGFVAGIMQAFVPGDLEYVAYLMGKLLYVGVLYTYLSDAKNKKWYLIGGLVAILANSLAQGMFGELIYLGALSVMLILLGRKVTNTLKYSLVVTGMVFVLILQSIKSDYRDVAWLGKTEQSNTEAFFSLMLDRITNPDRFFNWTTMFPIVNRFNQGMIVGKVMAYVPQRAPFAEGETIFKSLAASFVPRLLWPNKPISGGQFNMERFTGYIIKGYSMNVSPMGEAYGNFGVQGGIIFMFFYGLFFSVVILLLLRMIKTKPTLILWFPVLFLNSIQIETDILMCVNSVIKNLIFIALCYWAADRFLRLKL
ncbi:MAG: hypothetical protein QM725_15650 [Lacibacter sp.]